MTWATRFPSRGPFDAVVSAFAIHHLEDARKRDLFAEIFSVLTANGMFANLEHVSSPTERLHREFLAAIGNAHGQEDASNRCASVADQLSWLAATGFTDVDCAWKWREMALLVARRPVRARLICAGVPLRDARTDVAQRVGPRLRPRPECLRSRSSSRSC